ncbi:unnamed protein product [Caenorhabditis bovis]|uniref:Uncharacterized protein n=1 Tax=Caenorhabditis bovis TaxID=2654633 RepID=A0A8S1F902_9PELO|nr:unnamed protein product [Caenorhabditis bovis]
MRLLLILLILLNVAFISTDVLRNMQVRRVCDKWEENDNSTASCTCVHYAIDRISRKTVSSPTRKSAQDNG